MSDRTSAALMGGIFARLAEDMENYDSDGFEVRRVARVVWKEMCAQGLDFSFSQMECDVALVDLHLADIGSGSTKYADTEGELR